MKNYISILFFSFLFVNSMAQEATIKGKIIDNKTKEPLIGVHVLLNDGTGVASDINGDYKISTKPGEYTLVFRFVGYTNQTQTIKVTAGEVKIIDISLLEANTELDIVVVSAGRYEQKLEDITVSMAVIKPSLIESKNTTNVETIIEQIPGCTMLDGQVSIRGGSGFAYGAGSRVLVCMDELPLLAADANDVKWNTLPTENVEQIEVIKGASSVLFGSSALNGVVNLRTAYPKDKPVTKIIVTSGIYDNPRRDSLRWWKTNPYYSGINFLHSQKFGALDITFGGAAFTDKGYREDEFEHRGRVNFNIRYRSKKVDGLSFGINGNYQYGKSGIFIIWKNTDNVYRPYGGADPYNNPSSTISINNGTRVNFDPFITYFTKKQARHSLRTRFYLTKNVNNTEQGSTAQMYYGEYQYSKKTKKDFNITAGVAGYYSGIVAELYGNHYGVNLASYIQTDKKIKKWNFSLGVRAEYYKIDSTETISNFRIVRKNDTITLPFQPVFRTGISYHAAKETYLRASFGQGYRFPSVAEKYVSTAVGALNIFPNPNVGAESGWSAELGIKQGIKLGKWVGYVDVAGFITQYENMMEFAFGVYNPPGVALNFNPTLPGYVFNWVGFRAQNAESARISGVDLSVVGSGKLFNKVNLTVFAGYTYMNPISLNTDSAYLKSFSSLYDTTVTPSNVLKYRYKHLAKADVQLDYKKWSFGWSVRFNSKMPNIDYAFINLGIPFPGSTLYIGDYILPGLPQYLKDHKYGMATVCDARLSYNLNDNAKISTVINNVFNLEYMGRPGDVQAPRTFALQVLVKF